MEIKHRVGLPRMDFHVMNRGARKLVIFPTDEDRALFVRLMGRFALEYEVKITSWCVMSTHYHIEPNTEGTPLYEMMRVLDGRYARIFNEKYDGSGCVFQGPFKSMAIPDVEGLAYVGRYIHANSRSRGYRPEDYPWSSCKSYLGLAPCPPWLDPAPVWEALGGKAGYRAYLEEAPPPRVKSEGQQTDDIEDFQLAYLRHLEKQFTEKLARLNGSLGQISVRTLVCWAGLHTCGFPSRILMSYYGYSSEEVVRVSVSRFGRRLDEDPLLKKLVATVNSVATRRG